MKNLALILGLMIAASPAFASRARLESLGEGKNGSFYINDSRNIFLNPAQIVKHKKKLWLEFGGEPGAVQDTAITPRGQGGFSNTFGDFTYGLYLNQTSERTLGTLSSLNTGLGASGIPAGFQFLAPDSTIEAFFAGEGAMNWGLSVFYAGNSEQGRSASQLGARLGIESGNLSVFTTVGIITKSNVSGAPVLGDLEAKGKIGIDAGVTYTMDSFTWFGKFLTIGTDVTSSNVAAQNAEYRLQNYGIGFGYTKEWSKTVTMFTRLEGDYQRQTVNGGSASKVWNVPIVLAAEAQALSWLAVRGSIAQSLLGRSDAGNHDLAGTTTVAGGLGATFGDVSIDGLISMGSTAPANGVTGFGTAPQSTGKFGLGDNMLSRVSLTYNF
jgi:hypothetical protein